MQANDPRLEFLKQRYGAQLEVVTGVLGLSFKADATTVRLDPRGLAAAVFLGLAIVLATSYLAFLTRGDRTDPPTTSGDWETGQVKVSSPARCAAP